MPDFYTVITESGLRSLGLATSQGQTLSITHAVVGDGNGVLITPNMSMTSLVHEVWRGTVAGVHSTEAEPNTLIFEFVIKADVGGFTIREVGLLDENGELFCIGNFPETEKPVVTDGSVRDLVVRLPLHFENAENVNLTIDTNVAVATKRDILDHNADPQAHGIMKSDAVNLNSSEQVATSKAVKTTYDNLVAHQADNSAHGIVKSHAVNSSSSDFATSKAVKQTYDRVVTHEKAATHLPSGGNEGDVLKKTGNSASWVQLVAKPVGHIELMPFPPDELPQHHYVPNGEGLLRTSEAGKTLRAMSAGYKAVWGITENSTHVFLPNLFGSNGDGYFFRPVNGVSRQVGNKQGDAIRDITGWIDLIDGFEFANPATAGAITAAASPRGTNNGHNKGGWDGARVSFDASRVVPTAYENRPINIGMIPTIYLPPLS